MGVLYFFIIMIALLPNKAYCDEKFFHSINNRLENLKSKKKFNSKKRMQYNQYESSYLNIHDNYEEIDDYNELNAELVSLSSTYATKMSNKLMSSIYKDSEIDLDFDVDDNGELKGNSKLKLNLYKNNYSTFFIETDAKVKNNNKWNGKIGIGQKLQVLKNWLFVYKTAMDYDFEEINKRGSFGVELHHKNWLKITSNYYMALSDIRDFQNTNYTKDRFTNEWETTLKTNLPFNKKISLNASFKKVYNDNLKIVDSGYVDEYNLWSYGIEYKPIKSLKTFLKNKNTKNDEITTEIGIDFVYKFKIF